MLNLIAMICTDEGISPKGDSINIEGLREYEILSEKLIQPLFESRALRNILVHDHNGIEKQLALESIQRLLPKLSEVGEVMLEWLKKK